MNFLKMIKLMDELKKDIILNENAYDDDLEETFNNVISTAQKLQDNLTKFLKENN